MKNTIDLGEYSLVAGRKSYSVRTDGLEFEVYRHKETNEQVCVERGTNKIVSPVKKKQIRTTVKVRVIPLRKKNNV